MNTALNSNPRVAYPGRIKKRQLEKIEAKTLLILGEFDHVVGNPDKNLRYAKKCFKNIKVEVVKTGHIVSMENPGEVNSLIIDFL